MAPFAPRRILAGTDFSELSTWALAHAVMWAQRFGAHLTVLHAQEFPPIGGDPYFGSYNLVGLIEASRDAVTKQLASEIQRFVPPDVEVSSAVAAGPAAAMIEEYARSEAADLVVLGTHGRGGIARFLLGSVAERALRLAHHPTLIVRRVPHETEGEAESPVLRRVLCPVNQTPVAQLALDHAVSVARRFGAQLTVVYAVEPISGAPAAPMLQRAEEELQSWLPAEVVKECRLQPVVRHGDAAEQIIELAREAEIDLIVIGAQHRPFFDATVLGVTTVRVTRHAPCPVLVTPREE